jgi:hypothetical protein
MDPAVRLIRVSNAVVQQLARLARETTTLTDLNTVELRIGEAQQLYPELWRHLDEARALLAERGRDVSRFDVVRAAEGQVLIGAVAERREYRVVQDAIIDEILKQEGTTLEDVVVAEVLRGVTIDIKAARFNVEGFRRAAAATHTLAAALPEVDWHALDRIEAEELARVGRLGPSHRSIVRWGAIGAAIIAAIVIGWLILRGDEQPPRDERQTMIAERKAQIEKLTAELGASCDTAKAQELAHLLVLDGRVRAARELRARCKLPQPGRRAGSDASQ